MRVAVQASSFDEERLRDEELADFRCQVCGLRYPFRLLVVQDGLKVCQPNCAYDMPPSQRDLVDAMAHVEAAKLDTKATVGNARRIGRGNLTSLMDGVSACLGFRSASAAYPTPIPVPIGGSAVAITLSGYALTDDDLLAYGAAGLSNTAPVIAADQTSMTFNLSASGATPAGDHDFLFNGNRYRKAFQVR